MAITELVFPTSGTPTVPTDYAYQNGYLAQNAKGYNAVSLTNWDATATAPQVASGSAIEINGATWQVDADTTILTTAATSGVNYLVFDDDAGAFGWDDGTPVWSATLNGWYIAGDRFTGHVCTWDGASSYTVKSKYHNDNQDGDEIIISSVGNVDLSSINSSSSGGWAGTYGTKTIAGADSWVIPAGAYMIVTNGGSKPNFEIYSGSAWIGDDSNPDGFIVSDGVNYRYRSITNPAAMVYRKIW